MIVEKRLHRWQIVHCYQIIKFNIHFFKEEIIKPLIVVLDKSFYIKECVWKNSLMLLLVIDQYGRSIPSQIRCQKLVLYWMFFDIKKFVLINLYSLFDHYTSFRNASIKLQNCVCLTCKRLQYTNSCISYFWQSW